MKNKIFMTVAMPLLGGIKTAPIALESLKNQEHPGVNWELIIMEEQFYAFGENNVNKYFKSLSKIGCSKIKYIPLYKWITLGQKYIEINNLSNKNSRIWVLQDADVYSPYNWLKTIKENFPFTLFHSPLAYFYDLNTNKMVLFKTNENKTGAYMAFESKCWKGLDSNKFKCQKLCNNWLWRIIKNRTKEIIIKTGYKTKKELKDYFTIYQTDNKEDLQWWQNGINFHGVNSISVGRSENIEESKSFIRTLKKYNTIEKDKIKLEHIIPINILEYLKQYLSETKKYPNPNEIAKMAKNKTKRNKKNSGTKRIL